MGERKYALGDLLRPLRELPIIMDGEMCTGRPTAPVMTRYRCFLPDLAGLAGLRRVGPGTGISLPLRTGLCLHRYLQHVQNLPGPSTPTNLAVMFLRLLLFVSFFSAVIHAQDVHVRVSPDVMTGIESTTEYPTIQMAMDHHPFAGPGADGKPGRVFIEIAPGTYHERVIVTQNHTNVTLLGMGKTPEDVVITNSLN